MLGDEEGAELGADDGDEDGAVLGEEEGAELLHLGRILTKVILLTKKTGQNASA